MNCNSSSLYNAPARKADSSRAVQCSLSPPFLSSRLCVCVPTPSSPERIVGLCGQPVG